MKKETVEQANKILTELEHCEYNLTNIEHTQSKNVVERSSFLTFNGIDKTIQVPKELFRTIGKLIQQEYRHKIKELEDELEQL